MSTAAAIRHRRDTAANWTSVNPVLLAGQMGYETDTRKHKFGDGTTAWNSLAYANAPTTSASDLTSGTLSTDRFSAYADLTAESKIGTGAAQVAAGDHGHAQLHDAVTVTDTSSINLTLTGQALSAETIFGSTSGTVCQGNDSRLSDARTPTSHTHVVQDITNITSGTAAPSGGADGDIYLQYI
jgi:hypothetical protein